MGEECKRSVNVKETWSETKMLLSFGGTQVPGTPDGMFEDCDGNLTCVQVVRVPIVPEMNLATMEDIVYNTVLTKIVKSQKWMISTRIKPHDFIIFCWLPPLPDGHPDLMGERTHALVDNVRKEGWPFFLKAMTPSHPEALFPLKFAWSQCGRYDRVCKNHTSECDLTTFAPTDFEADSEADDAEWRWNLFDVNEEDEHDGADLSTSDPMDFDGLDGEADDIEWQRDLFNVEEQDG